MPTSFGTSTSVIGLPERSGALLGCPPSYGLAAIAASVAAPVAAAAGASPAAHASGLTASVSAPSQRFSWARIDGSGEPMLTTTAHISTRATSEIVFLGMVTVLLLLLKTQKGNHWLMSVFCRYTSPPQ